VNANSSWRPWIKLYLTLNSGNSTNSSCLDFEIEEIKVSMNRSTF